MTYYTKFINKEPISIDTFTSDRVWKYRADIRSEHEGKCGFPEIYLDFDANESLEILAIGSYVYGYRTASDRENISIKKLISIIENEFSTVIYDESSHQYYGYESRYQQMNYEQLEYSSRRDQKIDEIIWYRITENRNRSIVLPKPSLSNKLDSKIYFGQHIIEEFPALFTEGKKREILIRINAAYRDEVLKESLINSQEKIRPVLEDVRNMPPKIFNEEEMERLDDIPF